MTNLVLRRAHEGDQAAIVDLYNFYIKETAITFDVKLYTIEMRRPWFAQFSDTGRYRLWVATQSDMVVGYAGTLRYREKEAYETSVETTIYVKNGFTGLGIGSRLYSALFDDIHSEDIHRAYAGITLPNDASIALHQRFGFVPIGAYSEVGRKFGRYWDVSWFEKQLS